MDTKIINRDVSFCLDTHRWFMDMTFEVKYEVDLSETQPGQKSYAVQVIERYPIYVSYYDNMDRQYEWRYGENMPPRIVNALAEVEPEIQSTIRMKLEDNPYGTA